MQNQQTPGPIPSPLSYPEAVSRPAVATKPQRAAKLKLIALMVMELTGCSRREAMAAAQHMIAQLEEAR